MGPSSDMTATTIDRDALRRFVYDELIARAHAPTAAEIGAHLGVPANAVRHTLRAGGMGKTILGNPDTGELWMAGPFSAVPTSYRVVARDATWYANCAWDMLGVPVLLKRPVRIETVCTDCLEPMSFGVDPATGLGPDAPDAIVHFLVPARRWYEDMGFT
jgi:hypothetical protein